MGPVASLQCLLQSFPTVLEYVAATDVELKVLLQNLLRIKETALHAGAARQYEHGRVGVQLKNSNRSNRIEFKGLKSAECHGLVWVT